MPTTATVTDRLPVNRQMQNDLSVQGTDENALRHVTVILLNGVNMDIVCAVNTTGRQLYDFVVSHLSLPEPAFFGLAFLAGRSYHTSCMS